MMDYLQGLVYDWCKNQKDEWFAARDLVGGDNFDWRGTPLHPLYFNQSDNGKDPEECLDIAKKALGRLLKKVLAGDKRTFYIKKESLSNKYLWVGNEP